jgi:hypothetical protein
VLNIQILEVETLLILKGMKEALEKVRVLVAMNPLFVKTGLNQLKLETGPGVEGKPVPILSVHPQVADEQTFRRAGQVQDANKLVHFGA